MATERVTFDGTTVELTEVTMGWSPTMGEWVSGFEPASGHWQRISLALVETREAVA